MAKKKLVPKTLDELDKRTLEEISPNFVQEENIKMPVTVCLLCTSDRIKKVNPEVRLEEKVLHECLTCKERFYK